MKTHFWRKPAFVGFFCFSFSLLPAQTPCENGKAGAYPCQKIDLLGHLSPEALGAVPDDGVYLNDIWGWTDPEDGSEYALVGMANGTAFVNISDPANPWLVGVLPEPEASAAGSVRLNNQDKSAHLEGKSVWRDLKVYQDHVFIVSDYNGEHGMQVFDLRQLRTAENAPVEFTETAHYAGISRAHNIVINEESGFAFIVGASGAAVCGEGGLHMVDIRNPSEPVYAGCFDADGYTHDAQCVIYQGPDAEHQGKEICFAANEDAVTLVDVSDKANPIQLSSETYSGRQYIHQGWLTEDQQYFLSNDELDEYRNGHNTRTYIWDVRDLDSPQMIGVYEAATTSIDHNLYIHQGRVYESNYTSGLRVLSLEQVAEGKLSEQAYFDTHPADNAKAFQGSWSNYPFFSSGVIAVSDITQGLFLLKLTDKDQPTGVEEEALRQALKIYPNPARNFLHLSLEGGDQTFEKLALFSLAGEKLLELQAGGQQAELSLPPAPGYYLLQIQSSQALITQKVLVE